MAKKIAVIDGNSLMHRAFHAVPDNMNAADGTPTNAAFGFLSMLIKFIERDKPDAIICAFDAGRPAFRMEALEQYKAQRPPMNDNLKVQFPVVEELLTSMAIPVVRIKGWEGDDILGTIAARNEKLGFETLLVTGDKDAYQLASNLTRIVTTKKGITDVVYYGPDEVVARYGITPSQVPDYLGLKGDSSDNIPGVPGIGEKTATKLLQTYGSLEGLYKHLGDLKGKQRQNIEENKEAAFMSRTVATIVRDLDFPLDLESVHFPAFDVNTVTEAFKKVQFNAHLTKVLRLVGEQPIREEVKLEPGDVLVGKKAQELLDKVCCEQRCVGVAYRKCDQQTLFDEPYLALNDEECSAVFSGQAAHEAFARIVKEAPFVALEVKDCVHEVYPSDTGMPALVSDSDVLHMRAFDLGLAAYVLNSSVSEYTYDALLNQYAGGMLPETKTEEEKTVLQAVAARVLQEPLKTALEKDGSLTIYNDIDLPLVSVLAIMERTGACIDCEALHRLSGQTQKEIDELRARIIELAGEEFNLDSPQQLSHILFEVLGLPPKKKTQRGFSTDASVLKELASLHEMPQLLLRYRELAKIKSTYLDALPRMRAVGDGRVHTQFNETVTATGRLSSSDPNLQNIPVRTDFGRKIRECFLPLREGELFLSADYSQIELRLLAHLSEDEHLIAAFKSDMDFHAATASRVFGIPIEEVSANLRSRAKAVNFGIVYGQQAFGLSQSLRIPVAEAKEMIDRYFEAYPGVRAFLDQVIHQAKDCGYAETLFGRKRHIAELSSRNFNVRSFGERTAMNHPMQGTAADIIKLAMIEVQRRLEAAQLETRVMIQVHDELDLSVPINEVEEVCKLVKDAMESVVDLRVPLVAEVSVGNNWAEAH